MQTVQLRTGRSSVVDDGELETFHETVRAQEILAAAAGLSTSAMGEQELSDEPYDLEVVKPRAIDLRKLWKLAGKSAPPELEAALGPSVPILLVHGMTPFHKPGERPRDVWGMGYEARLEDPSDAATISVVPEFEARQVGHLDAKVQVGLSAGGEMQIPGAALSVVQTLPVALQGVRLETTTDVKFGLALQMDISLLKVSAGPVGAGGARWNLYRQTERLDRYQPLLQTLLVPVGVQRLRFAVTTWIRRRGFLFGMFGSRQWTSSPVRFDVSLDGLVG